MKRFSILVLSLLFLGLAFVPAYAANQQSATAAVTVNVDPNIAVSSQTPILDMGSTSTTGPVANLVFRVDANAQFVTMMIEGSSLYKGDDPVTVVAPPIPIKVSQPVIVTPTYGNRVNALANQLVWVGAIGTDEKIGNYPAIATETATFESSQVGHYSQNVGYAITYNPPALEQPTGQYSGKVRLTVALLPTQD